MLLDSVPLEGPGRDLRGAAGWDQSIQHPLAPPQNTAGMTHHAAESLANRGPRLGDGLNSLLTSKF